MNCPTILYNIYMWIQVNCGPYSVVGHVSGTGFPPYMKNLENLEFCHLFSMTGKCMEFAQKVFKKHGILTLNLEKT